jgi:hypothetical protein
MIKSKLELEARQMCKIDEETSLAQNARLRKELKTAEDRLSIMQTYVRAHDATLKELRQMSPM